MTKAKAKKTSSSDKKAAPAAKKAPAKKKLPTRALAVKYESDGMSIGEFEKLSAKRKGLSIEEWRKASLKELKGAGKGSDLAKAAKFLEDRNWADTTKNPVGSDGAMKSLLDTSGYSKAKGDLPSQRDFWKYLYGKKLALEQDWQYKTSVSFVTKDAKGNVTSTVYADTSKLPSLARHAGASNKPLGSFMKVVTNKDPDNPLAYGRILDGGSLKKTEAEVGMGMARNLGDASPNPALGPTSSLMENADVTTVAANPTAQSQFDIDGMLDNEHTQYAGWLAEYKGAKYDDIATNKALDKTMEKYKDDADFKAYQEKVKAALKKQADADAAGDRVESGEKTNVFVGEEKRELATKGAKTKSGDELKEGVQGFYAGKNGKPVAVVGTGTVQGKAVKNGANHVQVGGPNTTREARPSR